MKALFTAALACAALVAWPASAQDARPSLPVVTVEGGEGTIFRFEVSTARRATVAKYGSNEFRAIDVEIYDAKSGEWSKGRMFITGCPGATGKPRWTIEKGEPNSWQPGKAGDVESLVTSVACAAATWSARDKM